MLTDNKSSTSKGNEDLAHDDVADVALLTAEVDHKTSTKHEKWEAEEKAGPFEMLGGSDVCTKNHTPEAGTDIVDLGHVTGI